MNVLDDAAFVVAHSRNVTVRTDRVAAVAAQVL